MLVAPGRFTKTHVVKLRGLRQLWQERGGPPVLPQSRWGCGTGVIRDLIHELGGTVELIHSHEAVHCILEIPAHWIVVTPLAHLHDVYVHTSTNSPAQSLTRVVLITSRLNPTSRSAQEWL